MSMPDHYPIGWMCGCGWQPDFGLPHPIAGQLLAHLESGGWVAVSDQITNLIFRPGWAGP